MVNFVLSFCKITGASKIFSRNFYLPLLKPLTPREAFRTFRITGKWLLGSKIQRYIPVLMNHKKKRSKNVKDYGKLKHEEMLDYTYMIPILDPENETQKLLLNILEKEARTGVFVYTIEDKKLNIVLQAQLEYAVRNGDVIDILVSQKTDKVLIKLKDFKKVPMELDYYDIQETMFRGEGATTEKDEKLHHYGKYTMSLAKIFEDKERQEEEWELMLKKIIKCRKRHAIEKRKEYKALVRENMKKLDWDQFEEDAKKVVDEINEQGHEKPIDMEIDDLEKTLYVNELFDESDHLMSQLPTMNEIADILKNMGSAHLHDIFIDGENKNDNEYCSKKISGVKVVLSSGREIFVIGQIVHTEDGDLFVPGQTTNTKHGLEFIPGFTVNIDGKPSLINGLIMAQNENDPMFLPSQSAITVDGQLTFALTDDERPPPPSEEQMKMRTERRKKQREMLEPKKTDSASDESQNEETIENTLVENEEHVEKSEEEVIIMLIDEKEHLESDNSDTDSEISEMNSEMLRLKREQDRLELDELKKILLQDGMEKLISELEDKKLSLQRRLDELRKLAVESERPLISYATESDAIQIASRITSNKEIMYKIIDILLTLVRKTAIFRDRNKIHSENIFETTVIFDTDETNSKKYHNSSKRLKIFLKSSVVAANDVFKERPKDQLLALETIGEIFIDILINDMAFLGELTDLMSTAFERNEIGNILFKDLTLNYDNSKLNILNRIINQPEMKNNKILEDIEKLMTDHSEIVFEAFIKLSKANGEVLNYMLEYCKTHLSQVRKENDVMKLLKESMIDSTKKFVDNNFGEFIEEEPNLTAFLEESVYFAKALGLSDIAPRLSAIDEYGLKNIEKRDENFLKRVFLVRKLINKDYTMKNAIERLKKNTDLARFDPRIRQLVRESGVLLSDGLSLSNSRIIPLQLLKSQNLLGLEDFIIQRMEVLLPVLIIRNDLQAVIPKEASQGVQSGRMPYVLIDESGISNFKPLHSLAAIKGRKNAYHVTSNNYFNCNGDIDVLKERRQSVFSSRTAMNFA